MSTTTSLNHIRVRRWQRGSLVAGVLALLACAIGGLFDPGQLFRAWLSAYVFFLGIPLGAMAVLMIYHLTGGAWGLLLRRILEAAMRTMPLLAVLFVPIAFGLGHLYLWAQPEIVAQNDLLRSQQYYLNPSFFLARAVVYFLVWMAMAFFFGLWSRQQDMTESLRPEWKAIQLSGFGAVIYGVTIHFAAIDWVMSLQSEFPSTIFGPLIASGQLLSGLAFAAVVLAWLIPRPPLADVASSGRKGTGTFFGRQLLWGWQGPKGRKMSQSPAACDRLLADVASPKALNDVGSLLFSLLVIWAYMAWFQFMLVWIANLPHEVIWYLPRFRGGWLVVVWVLILLHFVLPFFLLLVRSVKRNITTLAGIAGLILFMQLVYDYWQVLPVFHADGLGQHWMDFLTPIAMGGLWLPLFLWHLGRSPLVPVHDYNWAQALELRQSDEEEAAREEALAHG